MSTYTPHQFRKIVICGSMETDGEEISMLAQKFMDRRCKNVTTPMCAPFLSPKDAMEKLTNMTYFYKKIRMSDDVIVCSQGHISLETACELGYALALGKKITFTHEIDVGIVRAMLEGGMVDVLGEE